jgi:cytochrome c
MRVKPILTTMVFAACAALSGPALAEGDAAAGEKVFRKCKACHATEDGVNKVGPTLYNVIGATPGTVEGYRYSKGMEAFGADHVWDEETLNAYLEKPRDVVEGTKMAFAGLAKPEDRADVIAYLKQFSQ